MARLDAISLSLRQGTVKEAECSDGCERTSFTRLSWAREGRPDLPLIVNLPGSPGGVRNTLDGLSLGLPHTCAMLRGEGLETDAARRCGT